MPGPKSSIDLDRPLSEFIAQRPETIAVFLRYKMLCVGCMIGPFHTIIDACAEHGVDEAAFIQALEKAISLGSAPR
ncbi:MAG: hybrid cluster-associated redox disulfide protein [Pseudorhodobacter sp.]|jgi:hybrid cluster-associated redox disulfide protein